MDNYERQREMLSKQVQFLDESLRKTSIKKRTVLENYDLIQKQVEKRIALKNALQSEIAVLDSLLNLSEEALNTSQRSALNKSKQLSSILRLTYYKGLMRKPWLEILMSSSLREAYFKWTNIERLRIRLSADLSRLNEQSAEIRDTIDHFAYLKGQKQELVDMEQKNMTGLNDKFKEGQKMLDQIGRREQAIRDEIRKQEDEDARLRQLISGFLGASTKEMMTGNTTLDMKEVNRNFIREKSTLDWPVDQSVVTKRFGVTSHPRFINVKTNNTGIDLLCEPESSVKSIYDGIVLMVSRQPLYNYIVIVNHGDYTSAYYYLQDVKVSKGDVVKEGEIIGSLPGSNINADFHFEIWKGKDQVNPENWLKKKN